MEAAAAQATLNALGHKTRYRIVELLAVGTGSSGMTPTDIAATLGIQRNLVSSHLAVLSAARLVVAERRGRNMVYVIVADTVLAVAEHLSSLAEEEDGSTIPTV